jgi:hypothetical protein
MKRFAIACALAGCGDKAVSALHELRDRACACDTYDCLTGVESSLEARAGEWKDPPDPDRARQAAEEVMTCLADSRARIDEATRRAVEQKLHGVDSAHDGAP